MIAIEVGTNATSFNCETCSHKNCDFDGSRTGSNGPGLPGQWEVKGVIRSRVCLLPIITELSREFLRLYSHYKKSVLMHSGGLYNQPHIYTQAMGVINAYQPTKN